MPEDAVVARHIGLHIGLLHPIEALFGLFHITSPQNSGGSLQRPMGRSPGHPEDKDYDRARLEFLRWLLISPEDVPEIQIRIWGQRVCLIAMVRTFWHNYRKARAHLMIMRTPKRAQCQSSVDMVSKHRQNTRDDATSNSLCVGQRRYTSS